MVLTQNANTVHGEYPIGNGKFDGTVSGDGKTLTGRWTESGGRYPYCGSLHPCDLTGTFSSSLGNLVLTQKGNTVRGTYEHNGGILEGTVSGDGKKITAHWTELDRAGEFYADIATNTCESFGGYRTDPKNNAGQWWLTRLPVSNGAGGATFTIGPKCDNIVGYFGYGDSNTNRGNWVGCKGSPC